MAFDPAIHKDLYGQNEPLLFPVRTTNQPFIHLARLVTEYFKMKKGTFYVYAIESSLFIENKNQDEEIYVQEIIDPELRNCLTKFMTIFPGQYLTEIGRNISALSINVSLSKIIGVGGIILKETKEIGQNFLNLELPSFI